MRIAEILRTKGHVVITIATSQTVLDAAQLLVDRNIGSLVVTTAEDLPVGIITERDILRLAAQRPTELSTIMVGTVMTKELISASPTDGLAEMMDVMTIHKIRHLPVMESGRLTGLISIGDLVNACRVGAERENANLRHYIQGVS